MKAEGPDRWQTQKLYIDPDLIQGGAGKLLMAAGEDAMRARGVRSSWLVVYEGNERAEDDGFARAGLAGDDVATRLELQRQVAHEGEVFDAQRRQHGEIQATDKHSWARMQKKKKQFTQGRQGAKGKRPKWKRIHLEISLLGGWA